MDLLKTISILLPVLIALSGAGLYLFNWYQEPNFNDGHCFTTAWIDYGVNQNTLNIEFVPDLEGAAILAIREALIRVEAKATINPKIDGKPMLVIMWFRNKTSLIEGGRFVITSKETAVILHGSREEKLTALSTVFAKAEVTFNDTYLMLQRDGRIEFIPRNNVDLGPDVITKEYLEHHYNEEGISYA